MTSRHSLKLAQSKIASLRLHGPDQKGIVAACSRILDTYGCGIMKSEQFTDTAVGHFYQRSLFYPSNNNEAGFPVKEKIAIQNEMDELKSEFGLNMVKINWRERPKKVVVFVSKYDHCLVSFISDILFHSYTVQLFKCYLSQPYLFPYDTYLIKNSGRFFCGMRRRN
jgi:formyltetrahydrofolate hydrolase